MDENDSDDFNTNQCSDTDNDLCEDCINGSYDPLNDGNDSDNDGICDISDICVNVADPNQTDSDNDNEGDACDCGDTIIVAGEDCDRGAVDTIDCDFDCSAVICGDGYTNAIAGEECDDGNTDNGDGCNSLCKTE